MQESNILEYQTPGPEVHEAYPNAHRSANASDSGLVRNVLTGYLATGMTMVTGLITTPILLSHLNVDRFGLWALCGSMIAYSGLVEFGLGSAMAKRVAEHEATGDRKQLERVLATGMVMYGCAAVLVLLTGAVLALCVGWLFHLSGDALTAARHCLLVLAANQAAFFIFNTQSAVLFGSGRLDLMQGASLLINVGVATANIVLMETGFGIVSLAVVLLVSSVVTGLVTRMIIARRFPGLKISPRGASRETAGMLLRFGARNGIVYICNDIAFGSDMLVIGLLLPVSAVAHYAIAAKLVTLVRTLATRPIDVTMPSHAHAHAIGDRGRQFRLLTGSLMIALSVAAPMIIGMCVFSDRVISLWVGPGHEAGRPVLLVLSLVLLFVLIGNASLAIMTGTERNTLLVKVTALGAPINLGLSVLFTLWLKSPVGVALGSLATVVVANGIVLPLYTCRQFGFDFKMYVAKVGGPLLWPTAGTLGIALALRQAGLPDGKAWTVGILGAVASTFVALWLAGGAEHRTAFIGQMRDLLKRRPQPPADAYGTTS